MVNTVAQLEILYDSNQVSGLSYYAFPSSILIILMGKEN